MRALVISFLIILLTACGKTGHLYLPDEKATAAEDKAGTEKTAIPADTNRN